MLSLGLVCSEDGHQQCFEVTGCECWTAGGGTSQLCSRAVVVWASEISHPWDFHCMTGLANPVLRLSAIHTHTIHRAEAIIQGLALALKGKSQIQMLCPILDAASKCSECSYNLTKCIACHGWMQLKQNKYRSAGMSVWLDTIVHGRGHTCHHEKVLKWRESSSVCVGHAVSTAKTPC